MQYNNIFYKIYYEYNIQYYIYLFGELFSEYQPIYGHHLFLLRFMESFKYITRIAI